MQGWMHHFWEDSFFGTGQTKMKDKRAAATKKRTGAE